MSVIPPSSALLAIPSIANTFGAWLICASIGCMLFGLTTHQTYRYFRLYPSDPVGLKYFVILLLLLDTVHTITNVHVVYWYLVTNWLDPLALTQGVWSIRVTILETTCVTLLSHLFFIRRIFLLGGRRVLPAILIGVLVVSEFAFAVAVTVMTFVLGRPIDSLRPYMWMVWVMLANAILIDIGMTAFLTYFLWKSRTGFKRTDSMVDVLMVYTINTGLSTSMLTFPALICVVVMPDNLVWGAMYVVASKMYANSLLAVLNSRRSLIDKGMEGLETGSFGLEVVDSSRKLHPMHCKIPTLRRTSADADDASKVKDTVIDIKVTPERFMEIPAPEGSLAPGGRRHGVPDGWQGANPASS